MNVLFLYSDDQRADTIGAWGNPHIRTPNLDRLVSEGFSFKRNYCFGGNSGAVCVPSRAMVNSGRTWFSVDNKMSNAKILPELLRENGYVTFATGKWHNGEASWMRGFMLGKSLYFGGMADHTQVPIQDLGPDGKLTEKRTGEKFSSELFADAVIGFLKDRKGEKPFYAYVPFTAPHDPRQPPVPYREMYSKKRPPLPTNYLPQHPFDNGHCAGGRDENLAAWPRTKEVISDQLCEYYGLITHMDEQIGRILQALDDTGLADNTLLIFASDQGLAVGSHGLLGKQSVYEHSMRSPLIFRGPAVPKGRSSQAFSYLFDIFPTVCEVLGVAPPPGVEGLSLAPIWQGKKRKVRDSIFLPFQKIQRAIRDERWKLIRYPQINHTQLFDLENDPDEVHDLAGNPENKATIERLLALMKQWQAKVGDTLPLTSDKPKPKEIDLTGRKRASDKWQPEWIRKKYFGEQ
ncbi:sulfatase-like hydrolase/transferase [Candidatus Bathyarchaeota archaeon]|nr:sulfatase-like hydrolase/transferase [Candidatus Bathyarchaeota archaeon]